MLGEAGVATGPGGGEGIRAGIDFATGCLFTVAGTGLAVG